MSSRSIAPYAMPNLVRWFSIVLAMALGAGYLFGPDSWASAPSFGYARDLLPIRAWGALFMVAAVLLSCTKVIGYGVSAALWLLWGTYLVFGAVKFGLTAWGGIVWPFYFGALMIMHVAQYGADRRERFINSRRG